MEFEARNIPPMSGLIAFHRTAVSGSVSAAAEHLCLTQSAVSRQIKSLEEFLGVALFVRSKHRMQLTTRGMRYFEEIRPLLDGLASATSGAGGSRRHAQALNIATISTFGAKWLIPRLPLFLDANPDIALNIMTRLNLFDFNLDRLDGAIHFGSASWPGTMSTRLFGERVAAVAVPDVARRIECVDDLAGSRLLQVASRPSAWDEWFRAAGLPSGGYRTEICVDTFAMCAEAALAGLGVALIPLMFVEGEIERGELEIVMEVIFDSSEAYHLITPISKKNWAPIRKFTEWIASVASDLSP